MTAYSTWIPARLLLLAAGGTLGVFLAGCASVRSAREAQDEARVPPGERSVTAAETGLTTNSVMTLDAAVRLALTYHPRMVQATQNVNSAEAALAVARAAYMPQVDASAGYRRGTANTGAEQADNDTSDAYTAGLQFDWLLFDFGKTPAIVRQAAAARLSAEESLRSARSDLAFETRTAFFDLCRAEALRDVARDSVRQYQARLDQVKAFAAVGQRTRYDVTKAEVDVGNAQLDLIRAANAVLTRRAALNRSLGLAEEPGYRLGEGTLPDIPGDEAGLLALARARHPALLALRAQVALASAAVDEAIADLYPGLSAGGSYGLAGSDFPLVWNWAGTLQSTLGLFTGGRKRARIDDAVAALRSARSRAAEREQQIGLELREGLGNLAGARERLDVTSLVLRQARESLDLVDERYRLGKASSVDVTDAQVAVTRAQAGQVDARFDYQSAIAQIKHAIGEE